MGYVYALLAALLFGMNGTVTKVVLDSGLTPAQLTMFRTLGTMLIAGAVLLATNRRAFRRSGRDLAVLAVLGVTGVALLQYFYAAALRLLPVGITLLLEYTAVLAVAVIAFVFFRERVKARLWVAIGCVLGGLAIVAQLDGGARLDPWAVLVALLAASSLTVYFLVGERLVTATSALAVAFWSMLFAGLFWSAFSGWWQIDPELFTSPVALTPGPSSLSVPLWLPLVWNIVLGSFAPFLLSFLAMRHLSATVVGIVASSEVIFGFAVAWVWRGETLTLTQLLGAGIVLVGIVLAQSARAGKALDADLAIKDDTRPVPVVGGSS